MQLSYLFINNKKRLGALAFVLTSANLFAADALPMKRILEEARAKKAAQEEENKAPFENDEFGAPRAERQAPQRKTRVYTMSPFGLTTLKERDSNKGADLELNNDPQREADANDGDDITSFEEVGAPLDQAHLAEFKLCSAARTEEGLNDHNTYWLSAMSAIAYLKYPIAFERLKQAGFEHIVFVEGPSDIEVLVAKKLPKRHPNGQIIKDSGLSVVAFRGSDDPEDWLTNLDATSSDISGHSGEAWLHEGFALALDEVYAEIIKALDLKNNPSPIFLTGHSQGGALATQMLVRMVSSEDGEAAPLIGPKDDRIRGLYVWAVPRVGNDWARNILDKYMNRTRNVAVNIHSNADPAPKGPFHWLGYRRFGVQAVVPYSSKDQVDYGNRGQWVCHNDADYKGPGAFDSDLWYTSVEAHYLRSYIKHVKPWRQRLAATTSCADATLTWGPRFQEENPATFQALRRHDQVSRNACDYTAFSWGGNIQL